MSFASDEETKEFFTEAGDLLDQAESDLLALEGGGDFQKGYNSVFRVLHSLKGAAATLGLTAMQKHFHSLESSFSKTGERKKIAKEEVTFFLSGIDAARRIMRGEAVTFDHAFPPAAPASSAQKPQKPAAPVAAPRPAKAAAAKPRLGLAYVVDDEPEIVQILTDILESADIETKGFTDPTVLLAAARDKMSDLIVTDLKMPGMSGLELLKAVREFDADVPVMMVSGFLTKPGLIEALESGLFAAVEKPFNESVVLTYALTALRQHRLHKMFRRSLHLLLYQFVDLDEFLRTQGKTDIATTITNELNLLNAQWKTMHAPKAPEKRSPHGPDPSR